MFFATQQQTGVVIGKEKVLLRGAVLLFIKSFKINTLGGLFNCEYSSQEGLFQKVF